MSLNSGRSLSSLVTVSLASAIVVIGAVAAHASSVVPAHARVTASPTPTAASTPAPIDEATAYWFCRAAVYRWAYRHPAVGRFAVRTYSKASIVEHGAGRRVTVADGVSATGSAGGSAVWCDVSGTAQHPTLVRARMPR